MRFRRRGGRKRIVAPDGSAIVPSSKPQPDGTLVKALARAWRWQNLLDTGVYGSVTEISEAEGINESYISRILRLALLAPDVVKGIVEGQADQALMLEKLERPLPANWEEQRRWLPAVAIDCADRSTVGAHACTVPHDLQGATVARMERGPAPSRCGGPTEGLARAR